MDKKICYALARKWANAVKKTAVVIRRRACWDFYEKNKQPKGWTPEAEIEPAKDDSKDSVKETAKKKINESVSKDKAKSD